uniref:Rep n=3 Tax=Porcine circovirus 2 TaxID=85708 RepID=J7FT93_PCV2|nr:Rep [Porcine circovirus 2]
MPSKKNGRSGPQPHKRWVFTLNNPSEDERKKIRELPISLFDYFIVGEEGNEEGRIAHSPITLGDGGAGPEFNLNLSYSVVFKGYRDFVGPPSRGNKVVNIKSHHVHRPGGRSDCGSLDSISEGAGEAGVEDAIFPSPTVAVAGVDEPGAAAEDLAKMAAGAVSSSAVTPPWIRHS